MNNHQSHLSSSVHATMQHWHYVEPFAKTPSTQKEYRQQQQLLKELMALKSNKKDHHVITLLQLIARNLKIYEDEHFPLKKTASPIEILQYLMEEHGLTQADLPEIGSQSLVSKILQGKRKLTAEQIANLSHRFHISPAVFY